MVDITPEWLAPRSMVALLSAADLVILVFLWYGPVVLERRAVERLRPLAITLIVIAGALTIWSAILGSHPVPSLLLGLPALVYLGYTWSSRYLDRLEDSPRRAFGGSIVGRWRRGVESSERTRRTRDG